MYSRFSWMMVLISFLLFVSCSGKKPSVSITQYNDSTHITGVAPFQNAVFCATTGGLVKWELADSSYTVFTTADGLPSNILSDVIVDSEGKIWIGTENGVSVFDGTSFKNFGESDGLPSVKINDLAIDKNDILWLATANGVVTYKQGRFSLLDEENSPGKQSILCIFIDQGENVWIGTENDCIYFKLQGEWQHSTQQKDKFTSPIFSTIGQSWDSSIWTGSLMGINRWNGRSWQNVTLSIIPMGYDTRYISSAGEVLWVFSGDGVHWNKGSDWIHYDESMGLISNDVISGYVVSDEKAYVGTAAGLSIIENDTVKNYVISKNNPVGTNFISTRVDDSNRIWFGTMEDELNLYDGETWTQLKINDDKTFPTVRSINIDPEGKIVFNTVSGIIFKNNDELNIQNRMDGVSDDDVRCGVYDNNGSYWAGTAAGICYYENGSWRRYHELHGLPSEDTWSCGKDMSGTLWFGTTKGIVSFTEKVMADRTPEIGFEEIDVRSIAVDGNRTLFGTNDGKIVEYADGSWDVYGYNYLGTRKSINAILVDPTGALWFGTNGDGIFYHNKGIKAHYTYADGLPSNFIHSLDYRNGSLWAACYGGVMNLEIIQIND